MRVCTYHSSLDRPVLQQTKKICGIKKRDRGWEIIVSRLKMKMTPAYRAFSDSLEIGMIWECAVVFRGRCSEDSVLQFVSSYILEKHEQEDSWQKRDKQRTLCILAKSSCRISRRHQFVQDEEVSRSLAQVKVIIYQSDRRKGHHSIVVRYGVKLESNFCFPCYQKEHSG